jgi:hypothetical protein
MNKLIITSHYVDEVAVFNLTGDLSLGKGHTELGAAIRLAIHGFKRARRTGGRVSFSTKERRKNEASAFELPRPGNNADDQTFDNF